MKRKIVLFDFDGVIVDSFEAAFRVSKMIYPPLSADHYRKLFEGNINDSDHAFDEAPEFRRDIDFFGEYLPMLKDQLIFPGIREAIKDIAEDHSLVIVSSTTTNPIPEYLKQQDLVHCFQDILGNDVHQKKVEKIAMVFKNFQVAASDCLFITDTLGDLREAAQAGVAALAVTWGFNRQEVLAYGAPKAFVEEPKDLPAAVRNHFDSLL